MTAAWFRSTSGGDNPPCHVVGHATAAQRYQAAFVILDSLGLLFREAHPLLVEGGLDGPGGDIGRAHTARARTSAILSVSRRPCSS
jgi:hypothetical protein